MALNTTLKTYDNHLDLPQENAYKLITEAEEEREVRNPTHMNSAINPRDAAFFYYKKHM